MKQMLQPVLFSCCNSIFSGMLRAYWRFLSLSRFFSLFSSVHILWIESLFLALRSFGSSPFRETPARASMWSFTGLRSCVVSNSFDIYCFELGPGFDLAPFRKNVSRTFFPKTTVPWRLEVLRAWVCSKNVIGFKYQLDRISAFCFF